MRAEIKPLSPTDAEAASRLHRACLLEGWSAASFVELIGASGVLGWKILAHGKLVALALLRIVADEAELLTLAVSPASRRQGRGRRLLEEAIAEAHRRGAAALFLELRIGNEAARTLYRQAGFTEVARRVGYYVGPAGREDACVLRRELR